MQFKLRITNTSTYIDGVPDERPLDEDARKPIKKLKEQLREAVGFRDENAPFRAMNIPGYDGLVHTLCHGYGSTPCKCGMKKKGMHFPTGLIGNVIRLFKEEAHTYRIEDCRPAVEQDSRYSLSTDMESRDYQIEIVDKAIKWNRGLVKLATGGGGRLVLRPV